MLCHLLLLGIVFLFCTDDVKQGGFLYGADINDAEEEAVFSLEPGGISFSRVHVPAGRLSDVVRDDARYIPMDVDDFNSVVQQHLPSDASGALNAPQPVAEHVIYEMRLDESGSLRGNISVRFNSSGGECEVWPGDVQFENILWFGEESTDSNQFDWLNAQAQVQPIDSSPEPNGIPIDLYGKPGGSIGFQALGMGRLFANLRLMPVRADRLLGRGVSLNVGESTFLFPEIASLSTVLVLDLPETCVPLITGNVPSVDTGSKGESDSNQYRRWRYVLGPRQSLEIALSSRRSSRCSLWSRASIGERTVEIGTVVLPETVWSERSLRFKIEEQVTVVSARSFDVSSTRMTTFHEMEVCRESANVVSVVLPATLIGTNTGILVRSSISSIPRENERLRLPGVAIDPEFWVGGGFVVNVVNSLQVSDVQQKNCSVVSPEKAKNWPQAVDMDVGTTTRQAIESTNMPGLAFEQQYADGSCDISLVERQPDFDVSRVTTVDVSSASLIGRAACDIHVRRGSVHSIVGRIRKEWFIDSVEPLIAEDTTGTRGEGTEEFTSEGPRSDLGKELRPSYEWKVVRGKNGDQFVLDLPQAVHDGESLRIKIIGHRRGVPAGTLMRSTDADMIQLVGETTEHAWLDLRTSPETTLVKVKGPGNELPFEHRLTQLAEEGVWRQRVPVGLFTEPTVFRFLRRRPPLEVLTQSQFTVRGDQLSETYSFLCQGFQGELDAVTVHFSEPVGKLDWSILSDNKTTAIARRLNMTELDTRAESNSIKKNAKESWLVELNPPVTGATTLRATGKRDFAEQTAIPLAWVESAISPQGCIDIQAVRGSRPSVLNHHLVQLPPQVGQLDVPIQPVMKLLYNESALSQSEPSLEILPLRDSAHSVARAWVWRECVRVQCYASANAEYETNFVIENDGRQSVTVSLPSGHRLIGLEVQGESIPLQSSNVREFPVYLPAGRQRVFVTVHTAVAAQFVQGIWKLSSVVPAVDAPTLTREMQVDIPKNVRLVGVPRGYTEIFQQKTDWLERISGLSQRESWFAKTNPEATLSAFDSRWFVPTSGRYQPRLFLLVSRWLLVVTVLGIATVAALLSLTVFWKSAWFLFTGAVVASVAALWVPQPFDLIARASLWGILAAACFRVWLYGRVKKQISVVVCLMMFSGACAYGNDVPLQVFVTPVDGVTTALVPEPLYKVLSKTSVEQLSAVRILNSKIEVPSVFDSAAEDDNEIWNINLLVEADSNGVLLLDQSHVGGRFANEPFLLDGGVLKATLSAARNQVRLVLPSGGKHSLVIPVEPRRTHRGKIEVYEITLPTSPQTIVTTTSPDGTASLQGLNRDIQCEWSNSWGVFYPAQEVIPQRPRQQMFRIPPAKHLRIVRSLDPNDSLTTVVRESQSRNLISWTPNNIVLTAEFNIDGGGAILPSFWIQADPRLVLDQAQFNKAATHRIGDFEVQSLGQGIYRLDHCEPNADKTIFQLSFRMPLFNLTGKYELPYVWIRGVERDIRESILSASPGVSFDVQFPRAIAPPQVNDIGDGSLQWFTELIQSGDESLPVISSNSFPSEGLGANRLPTVLRRQVAYVDVSRARTPLRGTQQIEVVESADKNHLVYEATIDSSEMAWAEDHITIPEGYRLESCYVFEKDDWQSSPEDDRILDISVQKKDRNTYGVVLQQPRSGVFLLRIQASSDTRLPGNGILPLVQSSSALNFPYSVIWGSLSQRANITIRGDQHGSNFDPVQESNPDGQGLTEIRAISDGQSNMWRVELPSNDIKWSYCSEIESGRERSDRPESVSISLEADPRPIVESSLTVPLLDIEVMIDERGRISGVCRVEVPMAAPEAKIRVPTGFRIYEILLDGQQIEAKTPRRDSPSEVWTVPIQLASWPRELVFVFVGEFEPTTMEGQPVSLALPGVVGMPVEQILWTINHPVSRSVRFSGPVAVLNKNESREIRMEKQAEIDDLIVTISPALPERVRVRLEAFRLSRRNTRGVPPLESWVNNAPSSLDIHHISPQVTSPFLKSRRWKKLVIQPQTSREAITIRFADSHLSGTGRTTVTLLILVFGVWFCLGATKYAHVMLTLANRWWPAFACVIATGWIIYREPAWPGFMLFLISVGAGLGRLLHIYSGLELYSVVADQPTVRYGASPGASISASTRIIDSMHESSTVTHFDSSNN